MLYDQSQDGFKKQEKFFCQAMTSDSLMIQSGIRKASLC